VDVKDFLVDERTLILDAMAQLNALGKKILFVTSENQLAATLTDGDIRRWILAKGDLKASIDKLANYKPKYLLKKEESNAKQVMREYGIEVLPIVDQAMAVVAVVFRNDQIIEKPKKIDVPVVIMAGGLGTRLYPYTKILPKPLIPIGELPIAEHIINRFVKQGASDFFLIVNHKRNMIKAYFNEIEKSYRLRYVDEESPLGTGGGLSLLKEKIKSTFILSNCDILIDEDYEEILNYHNERQNFITMVCSLKNIEIPYGVIDISETGEIERIREKPTFPFFTNTGMYIVSNEVVKDLVEGEHVDFPDIIEKYRTSGKKIGVYPISDKSWLDMGQIDELEEMRKRLER